MHYTHYALIERHFFLISHLDRTAEAKYGYTYQNPAMYSWYANL